MNLPQSFDAFDRLRGNNYLKLKRKSKVNQLISKDFQQLIHSNLARRYAMPDEPRGRDQGVNHAPGSGREQLVIRPNISTYSPSLNPIPLFFAPLQF